MRNATIAFVVLVTLPLKTLASCGSSSCPIDLSALNAGRFTLDLSYQSIDQDRPRIGTHAARVGEIPSDHDEIRTINRIAALQLGVRASDRLELSFTMPYVSRSHVHFDNESQQLERWDFGARGDLLAQARVRVSDAVWLIGGVKLPTGARNEGAVGGGEIAEVTIEPGSGSTDFIGGVGFRRGVVRETGFSGPMGHAVVIPLFASVTYRVNGHGTNEYRRGNELQVNAGSEYPITRTLMFLAQINGRHTAKDDPGDTLEDRDLTGGTYAYVSPGLRLRVTPGLSVYGFVQLPAYQRVNGIQLTARRNYVGGVRWQR